MPAKSECTLVTPPCLAKKLGVNNEKVIGWIRDGSLAAINLGEGQQKPRFRITPEAVEDFLRSRTVVPKPLPRAKTRKSDPAVKEFV